MRTELYWIPLDLAGKLAIAPRPRGGDWLEEEIPGWREAGIDTIVTLLTPEEIEELDLIAEAEVARCQGLQFREYPIPDRAVPESRATFCELLSELREHLVLGRRVAVHCRQGIGRAGLVAAGMIITEGIAPGEAVERVTRARGRSIPDTPEQRQWLESLAHETPTPALTGR